MARRSPVGWLVACGALLVAAIVIGTAVMVGQFRDRALSNAERELENTVLLLTRHFDQQLEDSGAIARNVASQMGIPTFASADMFRSQISSYDAHVTLKSKISALYDIGALNIYDSDGKLINSSADWPLPAVSIADRTFFKILKDSADPSAVMFEPVLSKFTREWTTVIANRLSGPDGTFLGILTRRVDPASFEKFFASVALGEGAAISLFHYDGQLIARYPQNPAMIGQNFRNTPMVTGVATHGGRHTLRTTSPIDGTQRVGSSAALNGYPIVVVATRTVSSVLADWRAQTQLMIAGALLLTLAIALTLILVVRQMSRQSRDTQEKLREQKRQLDTALNNMTQGLVLYDGSERLVLCNQRFIDMFGLSTDIVKPGADARTIMRHRVATGSFEGDADEFYDNVRRMIAKGEITTTLANSTDGRWFQIVNQPLPQGGWVATIEDVTERHRLEQERDRNYAFLNQILDHIPSQITVKDVRDRRYVLANRVAEDQFGKSRTEIVGKTAYEMFPEALGRDHHRRRRQDAANRRPVQGRASLGQHGARQALHHLDPHRHPRQCRRSALRRQRRQ